MQTYLFNQSVHKEGENDCFWTIDVKHKRGVIVIEHEGKIEVSATMYNQTTTFFASCFALGHQS